METSSLETSGKRNAGDKKNKHYNEHYYKDNLHLVVKVNEKLAKAIKTAFNVRILKQAGMPATLAETPSPTTRRPATSRRVPKHQKERQKQKPKHQQHQENVNCLKKKSRKIKKDNRDISNNANNLIRDN